MEVRALGGRCAAARPAVALDGEKEASPVLDPDPAYDQVREALSYPGPDPGCSYLLTATEALQMAPRRGATAGWDVLSPAGDRVDVERFLDRAGALPLESRFPVLAFGANRNPSHLAARLRSVPGLAVPVLRAVLHDVDVVFPAHVSAYGVVTATLMSSPGTDVNAYALLLSRAEVELLSAAEGVPSRHEFGLLESMRVDLELGERLTAAYGYLCSHPPAILRGAPKRLRRVEAARPRLDALDLPDVMTLLMERARDAGIEVGSIAELQRYAAQGEERRQALRLLLRSEGVAETGLPFVPTRWPPPARPPTFGDLVVRSSPSRARSWL